MTEPCNIECWPKEEIRAMSKQVGVIHDFVVAEKSAKDALEKAEDARQKNTHMYLALVGLSVVVVGALWGVFTIIGR